MLALLLTAVLLLAACDKGNTPTDSDTAETPVTQAPTDTPTDTPTEAPTEGETTPPAELTAAELKTLLAAALAKETGDATVTVKASMNGEVYSNQILTQKGEDFKAELISDGATEILAIVGDKAYYTFTVTDESSDTDERYVLTPTAEEREKLLALFGSETNMSDEELTEGLLNSTLTGQKLADGTVELTCADLDSDLVALLMGEPMEGAILSFDFTLDAEGRMTRMVFTVVLSGELLGGEALTVSSETSVSYTAEAIEAPANAADYTPATYDELFSITYADPEPEEAAAAGLPLDGDNYTVGGEDPAVDPLQQYYLLYFYPHSYADKTFTVYGNVLEDENGNLILSLGEEACFYLYFDGVSAPATGSYVKVTATFTRTVDMGDYMDFDCFTMVAAACEVLGEAKGPNGGKLMFVTASSLNVRSEPDSSKDNKVGLLNNGEMVEVLETGFGDGSWVKIVFDCDAGYAYVSGKYLSQDRP